ncbi:hypothetical protein BB561_002085 [Smittium simulii]|uniref:Programmed cell death protein 2 C-terminal domain-containing protein n=1 Tax=Smittium simulii TaxID=133385 RepID=A0A2T9YS20_9FUNG|nr:hypothetical protein BB561_002085 [Smittium simulii]
MSLQKTGPVLLAYADGKQSTRDASDIFINKLGGLPTWIKIKDVPIYPGINAATCNNCSSLMILLCQLYVPLDDSPYERFIYIWGCNKMECRDTPQCFKVIRGHQINNKYLNSLISKSQKNNTKKPPGSKPLKKYIAQASPKSKPSQNLGAKKFDFGSIWEDDSKDLTKDSRLLDENSKEKISSSINLDSKKSTDILAFNATEAEPNLKNNIQNVNTSPKCYNKYVATENQNIDSIDSFSEAFDKKTITNDFDYKKKEKNFNEFIEITSNPSWPLNMPYIESQYLDIESEFIDSSLSKPENNINKTDHILRLSENISSLNSKKSADIPLAVSDINDVPETWAGEKYERSVLPKGVDIGFQNFISVVLQNPEQCLRYQFGGIPLMYSITDNVSKTLGLEPKNSTNTLKESSSNGEVSKIGQNNTHSNPNLEKSFGASKDLSITKAQMLNQNISSENDLNQEYQTDEDEDEEFISTCNYTTKNIPKCPLCNGPRVFEFQLMPAILSVLDTSNVENADSSFVENLDISKLSIEENKKDLHEINNTENTISGSKLLKSLNIGMEFGTILIFTCKNDCHNGIYDLQATYSQLNSNKFSKPEYYEEVVLAQYESHLD